MRRGFPKNKKKLIQEDAKTFMQECVSEFILIVTGQAVQKVKKEDRRTITGDDLLWAFKELGFDNYHDILTPYLEKYKKMKRN